MLNPAVLQQPPQSLLTRARLTGKVLRSIPATPRPLQHYSTRHRWFTVQRSSPAGIPPAVTTARGDSSAEMAIEGPLDLSSTEALAADAVVWASQHGLVVGAGVEKPEVAVVHAPISLRPTDFPRASFQKAQAAAEPFNTLIDRVSQDGEYLQTTLAQAAQYDKFTAKLLEVYRQTAAVREARAGRELVLAINRSDYMLDEPSGTLLQVELNTIASSFGALSTLTTQLHRYILSRSATSAEQEAAWQDRGRVPDNDVTGEIAAAMALAVQEYGQQGAVLLMVVQPGERNAYDQQWLQTALWERHRVRTLRRTLAQLAKQAALGPTGALTVQGLRVAVVYLRAGYSPTDYPTEDEWRARSVLESSDAALCPSVGLQLAGAKKVQQDLARPDVLERFTDTAEDAALVRACFAGLWSLDDPSDPVTAAIIQQALQEPELFVLKPQREGGGNNLYGGLLAAKLREGRGLAAYILMQRIRPPINRSVLVRQGEVLEVDSLSELGVYGTFVRRGDKVLVNKQAGHLLRTKAATSDEGGVAAGFAVLDSPYLVE